MEQSKLDKFFSRLAHKRPRVEDSADSQDSQNVFGVDALEENDTDTHSTRNTCMQQPSPN